MTPVGPIAMTLWDGPLGSPTVVLLHSGVTDRRGWSPVANQLAAVCNVVAYDRRGYGESPLEGDVEVRELDTLDAVLAEAVSATSPLWLVGSSAGGEIALDAAILWPLRVHGLVLVAPAVSGAPSLDVLDAATQWLCDRIEEASAAGDLDERNRLEMWLWLDGPAAREGRVEATVRDAAAVMNATALRQGGVEAPGTSGIDAWAHLTDVRQHVLVVQGDLDVPCLVERSRILAESLPNGRLVECSGTAHLPYLERPDEIAALLSEAVIGSRPTD